MSKQLSEIMAALGQYACLYCGDTDVAKLVLEHVTGSGNAHRRALKRRGSSFYRWYAQQGYPEVLGEYSFGIACRACNLQKSLYEDRMRETNAATHKRKQVFGSIKESNYEWLQRRRQATHKTIGELLDPLIEQAMAIEQAIAAAELETPAESHVVMSGPSVSEKVADDPYAYRHGLPEDRTHVPTDSPAVSLPVPRRRGFFQWLRAGRR